MTDLRVDFCDHKAAEWAVKHWHYSKSMPTPPVIKMGVWENGKFIGCVLFSRGANKNLGNPYGLKTTEIAELSRVALSVHLTPVSKIISVAMGLLRKSQPGLRLIISFADTNESHIGIIYQAGNWIYTGRSNSTPKYVTPNGQILHQRQVSKTGWKPQYGEMRRVPMSSQCQVIPQLDKHRYLYPLDRAMRKQIQPLAKPYPKKIMRPADGGNLESIQAGQFDSDQAALV